MNTPASAAVPPVDSPERERKLTAGTILKMLGPGLITGAADDDPSGIATYSQIGAQFGYGMLWTMLFSYPLMAAIQEISARIGRVTGVGLAANIRRHYPVAVLYVALPLLLLSAVFNLGADIGAMGEAVQLIVPGPLVLYVVLLGAFSLLLQVLVPYTKYVFYLKWLTLVLFAYVAAAFVVHISWREALRGTFLPTFHSQAGFFAALIAVLGTTISPYLFFWQASMEVEDVSTNVQAQPLNQSPKQAPGAFARIRADTYFGMAVSNLIALFIIAVTAATLHAHGVLNVATAGQAAKALEPLAGRFAFVLFAVGIIGTGLLAVPVLAGCAAYAIGETLQWRSSLELKPRRAPQFYGTLVAATLIGVLLNFVGLNPIRALFWAAVANGVAAGPLQVVIMLMAGNPRVMGKFTLPGYLRAAGWLSAGVMILASAGMFFTLKK